MLARRPTSRKAPARRGAISFEALLILPLFTLVIFGAVGIADLVITEQLIDEASGRGARVAALGGSREQVEEAVRAVIGPERMKHAKVHIGPAARGGKKNDKNDDNDRKRKDRDDDSGERAVPPGGLLEVRVELPARHATATRLAPIRATETLVGRTVMQKE